MHLFAGECRTVRASVAKTLELLGLLQREIGEQSTIGVDGEAVHIGRVHTRGVFAHEVLIRDDVHVVEAREQILAQAPRKDRVQRSVGKGERRSDQKSHPLPIFAVHQRLR